MRAYDPLFSAVKGQTESNLIFCWCMRCNHLEGERVNGKKLNLHDIWNRLQIHDSGLTGSGQS